MGVLFSKLDWPVQTSSKVYHLLMLFLFGNCMTSHHPGTDILPSDVREGETPQRILSRIIEWLMLRSFALSKLVLWAGLKSSFISVKHQTKSEVKFPHVDQQTILLQRSPVTTGTLVPWQSQGAAPILNLSIFMIAIKFTESEHVFYIRAGQRVILRTRHVCLSCSLCKL